jgi:hypothetical protein
MSNSDISNSRNNIVAPALIAFGNSRSRFLHGLAQAEINEIVSAAKQRLIWQMPRL